MENISEVTELSQDNDIFNDQLSSKKLTVSKPTTSSNTNPALSTILKPYTFFENQGESFWNYTM